MTEYEAQLEKSLAGKRYVELLDALDKAQRDLGEVQARVNHLEQATHDAWWFYKGALSTEKS